MSETEFLAKVRSNQGIILKLVSLYAADAEEKKDLYQEVLLQAWKSYPSFRQDAAFATWLYKVSLNTILTYKRRQPRISYTNFEDEQSAPVTDGAGAVINAQSLKAALRMLPDTERAIISMHLDGFSNTEIAGVMGISSNNTAVKLHRIKLQLANILNVTP